MSRIYERLPLAYRLWRHFRKVESGCWEWNGAMCEGYGRTEFVVAAQIVVTARHGRPTAAKLEQLARARATKRALVNA